MTSANLQRFIDSARHRRWARGHAMDFTGACQGTAACLASADGVVCAGDYQERFTLMSAIKPFLLLHVLEMFGAAQVDAWVDDRTSTEPYYSLEQLMADGGRPRNAMINSGAMVLASKLAGGDPAAQMDSFLAWLSAFCPEAHITLHPEALAELTEPDADITNQMIAMVLRRTRQIDDHHAAFEAYFRLCCLQGSVRDIALLGLALARSSSIFRSRVIHTISHSGLYEATPQWMAATSLPAKSGVSGVVFALYPNGSCLAACDPLLDDGGNPVLPQRLLRAVSDSGLLN